MQSICEGLIEFIFPDSFTVIKYDADKSKGNKTDYFYKRQSFYEFAGGTKAVDFIVWDKAGSGPLWLIEVKDCRGASENTIKEYICQNIPQKVRDTFAGIIACALVSSEPSERSDIEDAISKRPIRVVEHIEVRDLSKISRIAKRLPAILSDYKALAVKNLHRAVGKENVLVTSSTIRNDDIPWTVTAHSAKTVYSKI